MKTTGRILMRDRVGCRSRHEQTPLTRLTDLDKVTDGGE